MFTRGLVFLAFLVLGGFVGWLLAAWPGAVVGVVLAALLAFYLDTLRLVRLQNWLMRLQSIEQDDPARIQVLPEAPAGGLLGEIADRMHRLLRWRIQAQRESKLQLQEMLAAIQASPNGVILLDAQGRIEWCNQTAAGHLGLDAARDVRQHVAHLIRDPLFNAYVAAADFSAPVSIAGRQNTPSRPVRLSLQVHPYGEGQRLLLSRDVTLIEQAEAMRRDFVANVSHELRTPLTVLSGFVETLQTLELPPQDVRRYLDLMAAQSNRMQTLVNDLLTLSRLEGSPLPTLNDKVGVDALLSQCEIDARALSSLLGRSEQTIEFVQDAPADLCGVATELQSALSNLVSNAIRYTPAQGRVSVSWKLLADGSGEFSVQDNGPGIAAEHLPRLTERFYRVDRSRSRDSGGTGLGLAIVKHVVQRHGAVLHIDSEPGRGSHFSIVFPASRVHRADTPAELKAA
jgi:two-component system phosphate regulon sensor histidine kinase PhoR